MKKEHFEKQIAKDYEQIISEFPTVKLAIISVPGTYAVEEAYRALDKGIHVVMISADVTLEEEVELKRKAHNKGLLFMGPDCGTEMMQWIPMAFANNVKQGKIGIVSTSVTGIQELITIIDRLGEGITNAISTGCRDLSIEVGGITMLDAINAMELDPRVEIVIVVSEPPGKEVRDKVISRLLSYTKPVVTVFMGERPEIHMKDFYHAYTLDEAARIAVCLIRGEKLSVDKFVPPSEIVFHREEMRTIKAYYSSGALANEAAMMIRDTMGFPVSLGRRESVILNYKQNVVMDFGDEFCGENESHSMKNTEKRIEYMERAADDSSTGVILFDIVIGYGVYENMVNSLIPVIRKLKSVSNRKIFFVATIIGSNMDPQGYDLQKKELESVGVIVCESNKHAVQTALYCSGYPYHEEEKEIIVKQKKEKFCPDVSKKIVSLFGNRPKMINIGSRSFAERLKEFGCDVEQFDWIPPEIKDIELIKAIDFFKKSRYK